MRQAVDERLLVGSVALLALSYGGAAFLTLVGVSALVVGHSEHLETVLFWLTFLGVLPSATVLAWRRLAALGTARAAACWTSASLLSLVLLVGRLAFFAAGSVGFELASLVGGAVLLCCMRYLWMTGADVHVQRRFGTRWYGFCAVLVVGAAAAFVPHRAWTPDRAIAAFLGGLILAAIIAPRAPAARVPARLIDAVVCAAAFVAVIDLTEYHASFRADQDFYLGPVNGVLHGSAMLVDSFAQYGVGVMYFLAGIFLVVPVGYGSFQFVNAVLSGIGFIVIYAVLRLACKRQRDAVLGLLVCVVANTLSGPGPHVAYGSVGWLRFGLPWLVVLLVVADARRPSTTARSLGFFLLGVSSLWSFETFIYTCGAWGAGLAVSALVSCSGAPAVRRRLAAGIGAGAASVVTAQVLLAVITYAATSHWPDWGGYLAFVRLYSWGGFGTLPIPPWSLGYAVAAFYFASAAAVASLVLRSRAQGAVQHPELAALASLTAFGVLSFTYFLGRSHPNNLHHVAPPVIALAFVWLSFLIEQRRGLGFQSAHAVALAVAGIVAAGLLVEQPSVTFHDLGRSPFGYGMRIGPTTVSQSRALIEDRPGDRRAVEGAGALDHLAPRRQRVSVVLSAADQTEVLIRAKRSNLLPIAIPKQDALLPERTLTRVRSRLDRLVTGSIVLTEQAYLPRDHHRAVAVRTADGLEIAVLDAIRQRFRYSTEMLRGTPFAVLRIEGRRRT